MKKSSIIISFIITLLSIAINSHARNGNFIVVIDPGHGGHDIGAPGIKTNEKTINLAVALKLGKLIEQNCNDVKVIYTRKTDKFIELRERANIANKAKADLFISIHANSLDKKNKQRTKISGASTYTLGLDRSDENLEVAKRENAVILLEDDHTTRYEGFDPNSTESYIIFEMMQNKYMTNSVEFASYIQKEFKQTADRTDRGVRQGALLVLRETSMPGVLVELDFICNPTQEKFMSSEQGQQKLARSIYNAFKHYRNTLLKQSSSTEIEGNPESGSEEFYATEKKNTTTQSDPKTTPQKVAVSKKKTTLYKIQILASPTKIKENSSQFKGLSPVSYFKENGLYKYTYKESKSLQEIKKYLPTVQKKFKDAFIIKVTE